MIKNWNIGIVEHWNNERLEYWKSEIWGFQRDGE